MNRWLELAGWREQVARLYLAEPRAGEAGVAAFRRGRDLLFREHPQSPLTAEQRAGFAGLPWFQYSPDARVETRLEQVERGEDLAIDTGGEDGTVRYRRVGRLATPFGSLTLLWTRGYGGGLFLPFRDATAPGQTYGAGRYLTDTIKGTFGRGLEVDGDQVTLDFNYAYNPSCAYDSRWACPLAPFENRLDGAVTAGELAFPEEADDRQRPAQHRPPHQQQPRQGWDEHPDEADQDGDPDEHETSGVHAHDSPLPARTSILAPSSWTAREPGRSPGAEADRREEAGMPEPAHPQGDQVSRRMWRALEPYHAVVFFVPETRRQTDALGLKGGWMSYFACRAAPLGAVRAEVVAALFYVFHPDVVRRAIPDAWSHASPEALLEARLAAVDQGLRRLLGPAIGSNGIGEAAELAATAAKATTTAGRPLAAGNAALPWPREPHLRLWQATTILREARGDGHVTALVTAGLSPCEALVTASAANGPPAEMLRTSRKWSQPEWAEAVERLRSRGWLDGQGASTEVGRAGRAQVELDTDELIRPTWDALGAEGASRLESLVQPLRERILASGGFPVPNPTGIT